MAMEAECVQIKITETEEGYRLDVKGKKLKDLLACCVKVVKDESAEGSNCCESSSNEKGGKSKCC